MRVSIDTNFVYIKTLSKLNEPFENQTKVDHSKSGHVRISGSPVFRSPLYFENLKTGMVW